MIRIVDPASGEERRRFSKIDYKLPKEIAETLMKEHSNENEKYKNILNKVNLANVQVYTDRVGNNIPLLNEVIANGRGG